MIRTTSTATKCRANCIIGTRWLGIAGPCHAAVQPWLGQTRNFDVDEVGLHTTSEVLDRDEERGFGVGHLSDVRVGQQPASKVEVTTGNALLGEEGALPVVASPGRGQEPVPHQVAGADLDGEGLVRRHRGGRGGDQQRWVERRSRSPHPSRSHAPWAVLEAVVCRQVALLAAGAEDVLVRDVRWFLGRWFVQRRLLRRLVGRGELRRSLVGRIGAWLVGGAGPRPTRGIDAWVVGRLRADRFGALVGRVRRRAGLSRGLRFVVLCDRRGGDGGPCATTTSACRGRGSGSA